MSLTRGYAISHWLKQATSVACGVYFGSTGSVGWNPVLSFFAILLVTSFIVVQTAAGDITVDEQASLLKEGVPSAVGCFFLSWVIAHTAMQ